jgi:hypothetical protein
MEPLYYSRITMAGWVFMAVITTSLWSSHHKYWAALLDQLHNANPLTVAIFGAIVGIGAPPALGFLLVNINIMMSLGSI